MTQNEYMGLLNENAHIKAQIENAKLKAELAGLQPKEAPCFPPITSYGCLQRALKESQQLAQDRLEVLKDFTMKLDLAVGELESVKEWLGNIRGTLKPAEDYGDNRDCFAVYTHIKSVLKEIA